MKRRFITALLTIALVPACVLAQGAATTGGGGGSTVSSSGATTSSATTSATTSSSTGSTTTTGGGGGNTTTSQPAPLVSPAPVRAMTSGTGSGTVSNTGPFVQSYIDPLSPGMPSKYATSVGLAKPTGTFAKALYTSTTTKAGGGNSTAIQNNVGFNTHGNVRAPAYSTVLSNEVPFVAHTSSELLGKVKGIVDRSAHVPSRGNIQIIVDGTIVQLNGSVANDKERRIVEGMIRMTPGVSDVVNQLTIGGQ